MAVTGFVIGTAQTSDVLASTAWSSQANILINDDTEAIESITAKNTPGTGSLTTGWIKVGNFGFDSLVPIGSVITKVELQYRWRVNSTAGVANRDAAWAVSGTRGTNVHELTTEPTALETITTDVTAERAWTRADLLNGVFEVHLRGLNGNSTSDPSYRFAWAKVQVTYTPPQADSGSSVESGTIQGSLQKTINADSPTTYTYPTDLYPTTDTDGSTSSINYGTTHVQNGPFTWLGWIKVNAADIYTRVVILACYQWGALAIDENGVLKFMNNAEANIAHSSVKILDTNWHMVAVTKSGATTKLYIDGVDVTTADTDTTLSDTAYWQGAGGGWENHAGTWGKGLVTNGGTGRLSNVAWWSGTALTGAQITGYYSFIPVSKSSSDSATGTDSSIDGWPTGWTFRKLITIDHTKVSGDQYDFPVLISRTDTAWKHTGSGGHVGKSDGTDIRFATRYGLKLSHEVDKYVSTTGELVAHVKIPYLSSTVDTEFWIYYGNASASDQQDKPGTWDGSYTAVYHFGDGSTLSVQDSTKNARHMTGFSSPAAAAGQVGGAVSFNGSNGMHIASALDLPNKAGHNFAEYWMKPGSLSVLGAPFCIGDQTAGFSFGVLQSNGTGASAGAVQGIWYVGSALATAYTVVDTTSWHHIAVGRITAGFSFASHMYVDGVRQAGTTDYGLYGVNQKSALGCRYLAAGTHDLYWVGTLDEVRFSNVVRSQGWITTSYNTQSSPSTFSTYGAEDGVPQSKSSSDSGTSYDTTIDEFTKSLLHFDGADASTTISDSATPGHVWTVAGSAQIDTAQSKFGGASAWFPAPGDYISTPDHADFTFTAGMPWTVDFWVRYANWPNDGDILSKFNPATAFGPFEIYASGSPLPDGHGPSGGVAVWMSSTTTYADIANGVLFGVPTAGVWNHVALVWTANNYGLGFWNGVQVFTVGDGVKVPAVTADPIRVGGGPDASWELFSGWLDEVRITKGIARWTANFIPPTTPYSDNLFPNPGVETNTDYWEGYGTSIARSNAQAHSGSWSLRVTPVADGGGVSMKGLGQGGIVWPNIPPANLIPLLPNSTYTWSVWVLTDVAGNYDLSFQQFDVNGDFAADQIITTYVPAGTWTRIGNTLKTGASAAYGLCDVRQKTGGISGFYADDGRLDNANLLLTKLNSSDSGTGADSATISVPISSADTGTGTDVGTAIIPATPVSGTDSGVGSETVTLVAKPSATDTSTGADVGTLTAQLPQTDSGAGADTQSVTGVATPVSGTDTSSGTDVATETAQLSATDSGTSAEVSVPIKQVTDTGTDSEAITEVARFTDTDAGIGTDTQSLTTGGVPKSDTDSGTSSEAITLAYQASAIDAASDTEVNVLAARFTDTDSGTDVELAAKLLAVVDTGTGTETTTSIASSSVVDTGTGQDRATDRGIIYADIATGIDDITRRAFILAETVVTVDVITRRAFILTDTAIGIDSGTWIIVQVDFGVGTDVAVIELVSLLYLYGAIITKAASPVGVFEKVARPDCIISRQKSANAIVRVREYV